MIDLRVRDVWSWDIPLVGAYSRYGWSHPGPIATWLVAPLSLLTGRPAWATLVGFALLQGVAIGLIGWLGWRHLDLHKTLFWFGVLSLGYIATGPWIYLEPWNPHVALPFFTLLAMLTWMVASGETAVLPWWVLAATFVVQTHLGYVPAVVVAAALVCPSVVRLIRAHGRAWFADKSLKWSALLLAVLWLPVVLETIVHFPGNVAEIVNHQVLHPSDPHHGLLSSLRLFASNFRGLPVWLGGADPASPIDGGLLESSLGWLLLPVAAVVALAWAERGLPRRFRELQRVAIGMIAAAFVAYLSTTGPQVPYLVYWVYPAAALLLLATAVVVARRLGLLRIAWVPRAGAVLLVVPVVWASVALTVDVASAPAELRPFRTGRPRAARAVAS